MKRRRKIKRIPVPKLRLSDEFITSCKTKSNVKKGIGTKDDEDKPKLTLIDPNFIIALAVHMQKGLSKYKRGNWQLDLDPERILNAEQRHSNAIAMNEVKDKQTGSHHSIAIAANAMMLYWSEKHGKPVRIEYGKY